MVEVVVRGRPALDQIPDFHKIVSETPHLQFSGPYRNPDDLESIYRGVHFTWAIDMYEEGLNSSWLLPNRLYEGGLFDTVPIALKSVETGQLLDRLGIGVTVAESLEDSLQDFFRTLTPERYDKLAEQARNVPREFWRHTREDCVSLVAYLSSLRR